MDRVMAKQTGSGSVDHGGGVPRIAPLPEDQWDARVQALLARAPRDASGQVLGIFATMARHPDLYERFTSFGGQLLYKGLLPVGDRELLILRTAHNTGAAYEWSHHAPIALAAGVSADELARIRRGPEADGWTNHQRQLLRAADELHKDARVHDATWQALTTFYGDADLIEIVMLVGMYHMVAFFLNSAAVQLEPGSEHADFSADASHLD